MAVATRSLSWLIVVGLAASTAAAQQPSPRDKNPSAVRRQGDEKSKERKLGGGLTPAREAAALAFVREHHQELESLLGSLKDRHPKQYEAAIRDLFRHSERLANIQERDAARYELELRAWKLQSRVQLLSATLLMNPSDNQAKAKLRQALIEQLRLRREVLALEREQVAKRLNRLDEQIERAAGDIEASADKQLEAILSGAKPKAKDVQTIATPSAK